MNQEILSLFKLILERNKLAKVRSRARSKLGRLKRYCFNRATQITVERIDELRAALIEYNASCDELKKFTKLNAKLRKDLQKKYKTKQRTDASNHITHIWIKPNELYPNFREHFNVTDIERIVIDEEIEGILLETRKYESIGDR
jgi:hypothetical protein